MFVKATRKVVVPKLCVIGPSGSGKTYSALTLAKGYLGGEGKIAVIDTENGSACSYAETFDFDHMQLRPPFTVNDYLKGIKEAVSEDYDMLIIDSMSHLWAGEGGLLDKKAALDSRGGNQYANWAPISSEYNQVLNAVVQCPIPLIVTLRSKMGYSQETNERGRTTITRVGLKPVFRDEFEYEFFVVFDVAANHNALALKDRTTLFDGATGVITEEWGAKLRDWVNNGARVVDIDEICARYDGTSKSASEKQVARILATAEQKGVPIIMSHRDDILMSFSDYKKTMMSLVSLDDKVGANQSETTEDEQ